MLRVNLDMLRHLSQLVWWLCIHQQTQRKKVIDMLPKLNLTITYDQILKIETGIANEISLMIKF